MENDSETQPLLEPQRKKRIWASTFRGLGSAVCIALIIATWLIMAEKLQDLGHRYYKPFFQAYIIRAFYSCIYVIWKLWIVFPGKFSCNKVGEGTLTNFRSLAISSAVLTWINYLSACLWYLSLTKTSVSIDWSFYLLLWQAMEYLRIGQPVPAAFVFGLLESFLHLTLLMHVSANSAIYQSASAVVFIISIPILRERVTLLKVISVGLTVAGVCLVSVFSQSPHSASSNATLSMALGTEGGVSGGGAIVGATSHPPENNTPLGYVYVVGSMIFYAVGEVMFKKFATKQNDPASIQNSIRLVGYFGVHTLMWVWPLLVVLHYTGLEPFELPDLPTLNMILLNAFLDIILNVSLYACIALSSPLIATIGSVLVIPASVVVDWLLRAYILPWVAILGIVSILMGFFALVFSETWEVFYWDKRFPTHLDKHSNLGLQWQGIVSDIETSTSINTVNTVTRLRKKRLVLYYFI